MHLGFDIDWSGLLKGATSGLLQYNQARNQVKLQMAQIQAQQAANVQAMQPPPVYPPQQAPAPRAGVYPQQPAVYRAPARSSLPSWAIPAGIAAAAVVGVALLSRPRT